MLFLEMDDITRWVLGALRGIAAWICKFVYELIAGVYELLFAVSRVRLLNQSVCMNAANTEQILQYQGADITTKAMCDAAGGVFTPSTISLIYQRVTLLLAIIMVFYVTFQFVKYLFTPEDMGDKEKGVEKLGFKLLTVVALLALVPTIFDKAYDLQEIILKNQFLAKIVLGTRVEDTDKFGRQFAANYLAHFYYFEPSLAYKYPANPDGSFPESDEKCDGIPCNMLVMRTMARFRTDGTLDMLEYGMSSTTDLNEQTDMFNIHFDALIALTTGVLILWMLIMYTIDVGMRVIQLTFLQVIAPIPIIAHLSPKKDGTFQKWIKQCTTTYLDLFLRLSILYFVMLLIEGINNAFASGTIIQNIPEADDTLKLFVYIVLILGLMRFCQKVPKLIEELFPSMGTSMGTFGLKPGERIPQAARRIAGAAVAGAAGAGIGLAQGFRQGMRASATGKNGFTKFLKGAAGSIQGAGRGVTGGLARGMYNGAKKGNMVKNMGTGVKNQLSSNKNFGNRLESGYKFRHQIQDKISDTMGTPDRKERLERQKKSKEDYRKVIDSCKGLNDDLKKIAQGKVDADKTTPKLEQARSKVKDLQENADVIKKYSTGGRIESELAAEAAYKSAQNRAAASINRDNYASESDYQKACQQARDSVNKNNYAVGSNFASQEDADAARSADIAKAKEELDAAEKEARFDYLDNGNDAMVKRTCQHKLDEIAEFEATHKLTKEEQASLNETKSKIIAIMEGRGSSKDYDSYSKGKDGYEENGLDPQSSRYSTDISKLQGEITNINNEREGSGIPGGKK